MNTLAKNLTAGQTIRWGAHHVIAIDTVSIDGPVVEISGTSHIDTNAEFDTVVEGRNGRVDLADLDPDALAAWQREAEMAKDADTVDLIDRLTGWHDGQPFTTAVEPTLTVEVVG